MGGLISATAIKTIQCHVYGTRGQSGWPTFNRERQFDKRRQ